MSTKPSLTKGRYVITPVKEKVQIWFQFLKLAYKSKDPELIAMLDKNKSKYEQWGNFRTTSWTQWWKNHSHLFSVPQLQELTIDDDFPTDTLVISIPFNKSKSQIANNVKRLYGLALEKRGRVPRNSHFKFSINAKTGKEHLVYAEKMRTYLMHAKDVYIPVTNSGLNISPKELLEKSIKAADKIKIRIRSSIRINAVNRVTLRDISRQKMNKAYAMQQIKRMNIYVENLLFNVASGIFPGEYNLKRKPSKIKTSKPKTVITTSSNPIKSTPSKATTSIVSTQSRYLQNKRKTDSLYGQWSPARRAAHEKSKSERIKQKSEEKNNKSG
jgi:hypothetical protein